MGNVTEQREWSIRFEPKPSGWRAESHRWQAHCGAPRLRLPDLLVACRLVDMLLGVVVEAHVDEKLTDHDRFDS